MFPHFFIYFGVFFVFVCFCFAGICTFEKTVTSPSLYRLASCRGRTSQISLARDLGMYLKSFLKMHLIWRCACNLPMREVCQSLFKELIIFCYFLCLSIIMPVLYCCNKLLSPPFSSAAIRH